MQHLGLVGAVLEHYYKGLDLELMVYQTSVERDCERSGGTCFAFGASGGGVFGIFYRRALIGCGQKLSHRASATCSIASLRTLYHSFSSMEKLCNPHSRCTGFKKVIGMLHFYLPYQPIMVTE